ncbi:monooxygenase family protein [Arthrobacter koreensis]|uniref:monooxygenase family protein n=1 Tax=Arthrobacter TaxID=1663 RepID=UPI0036DF6DA2
MPAAGFPAAGIRVSSGKLLIGMRVNRLHRPDLWMARSAPGAVGIWHETYVVDRVEPMYVGMPLTGLAAATGSREAGLHSGWDRRAGLPERRGHPAL